MRKKIPLLRAVGIGGVLFAVAATPAVAGPVIDGCAVQTVTAPTGTYFDYLID